MKQRRVAASLVCAVLILAPAASAEDPPLLEWSNVLPGLTGGHDPSSSNECKAGRIQCVDAVIREMYKRFGPLAQSCDHNSIFALSYLRTTEEYKRAVTTPDFFQDSNWLNHYDATFARYYFDQYDDWKAGRRSEVSQAWLTAFDSAKNRQIGATGNLFLGMNAHINRDLPYVLAEIGLVRPDGSSRKEDHDKVNHFLNRVADDLLPEIARRFDPSVDDAGVPGWIDDVITFQAIPSWREMAWRNAEALVSAPTPAARALVEQQIETYAATLATTVKLATAYPPLVGGAAQRDAYCATHWNS